MAASGGRAQEGHPALTLTPTLTLTLTLTQTLALPLTLPPTRIYLRKDTLLCLLSLCVQLLSLDRNAQHARPVPCSSLGWDRG